jgi:L-2-hydroxyglutarate oxidase
MTSSAREDWDVAVIGGGIVGLATARELAVERRLEVVVLEAERDIATHQTGRNSGVIHSGLYYRPGSEKAMLCAAGREALYDYCDRKGIPTRRCGKVVVATTSREVESLEALERRGRANGIFRIRRLVGDEIREREPEVRGLEALWVPETGIVDYRLVARELARDLTASGGEVRVDARVHEIRSDVRRVVVESQSGTFSCRSLVNCAGLESDRVARLAGVEPDVMIIPFRGEYFLLDGPLASRIRGLVYPVPDPALPFLGIHFTRTIDGRVLVGPNAVPALSRLGYRRRDVSLTDLAEIARFAGSWRLARRLWRTGINELSRTLSRRAFVAGARKLIPGVSGSDFAPAPSGVRAQAVSTDGELVDDFRVVGRGNMLHVLNAPSPAATAALAIARVIADRLEGKVSRSSHERLGSAMTRSGRESC